MQLLTTNKRMFVVTATRNMPSFLHAQNVIVPVIVLVSVKLLTGTDFAVTPLFIGSPTRLSVVG